MPPLRETVVCVQGSLASARGLRLHAVRWDHHEDEVRQELLLFLVQVIQIQAFVLLISIHALIIDMIKIYSKQPFSGFSLFVTSFHLSMDFAKLLTIKFPFPVIFFFLYTKQE